MSQRITRLLYVATLHIVAALWVIGIVGTAQAQNIAVSKDLCALSVCMSQVQSGLASVPPNTPVSYTITLINNDPTPLNVDLKETFQLGFHFVSSTCGPANPALPSSGGSTFFGPLALPPMATTTCTINGYFEYLPDSANNANNVVAVFASTDTNHQTPIATSNAVNATVSGSAPIPTDVSVAKFAGTPSINDTTGATTVTYTITITNNGPNDVYGMLLQDILSVPSSSVPLNVTFGSATCSVTVGSGNPPGGSTCFNPVPSVLNSPATVNASHPSDFAQWNYPAGTNGVLKPGDAIVITFSVVISPVSALGCVLDLQGNHLINSAHVVFTPPGATTTINDADPGNNTATTTVPIQINNLPVDPNCGSAILQVRKVEISTPPGVAYSWGSTVTYRITLRNLSTTQTINNIQLLDSNGVLGDIVQAGVGTPPFTAELVSWTCLSTICSGSQPSIGTAHQLTGYGDTQWMFGTTVYGPPNIGSLAPNTTVQLELQIKYSAPGCDSYPQIGFKPIHNFVRAAYQDPALGYTVVQSFPVTSWMFAPEACPFTVSKSAAGASRITFGTPVTYTVTFSNPGSQAHTVGTLIDTLQIAQPNYATQLPVTYSYTCTASPSGGVTGFPAGGSGSATVVYTSLPQQGVRIIQNTGPVTFQPQSTLICNVTVTVNQPSAGDPNCARDGTLVNTAIIDTSAFYNSNLPWPPGSNPGFAAQVALPLPQCLHLVINKWATPPPPWTTQNGGPLNYNLGITNLGGAIAPADGMTLTDTFTPSFTASTWNSVCSPPAPACAFTWNPNPTSNPSTLAISTLAQGQAIITSFQVPGPYTAPPSQICNQAVATVGTSGIPAGDWYAKDPATWQTNLCVPVFDTRPLQVRKTVTVVAPATAPPTTTFTVNVTCELNGIPYGPNPTLQFTYPPNPAVQTVVDIPVGSTCTFGEVPPSTAPVAVSACPSGLATWGQVTYPNPNGPDGTPQSVGIVTGTAPNSVTVHNTFACVPASTLTVTKTFDPSSPASNFPSPAIFPVQVTCGSSPATVVNLTAPSFQQVVPNIPVGTLCSISELPPTGTNVQANCSWESTYPLGQSVLVPNGGGALQVRNKLNCTGTLTVYKEFQPTSLAGQLPANVTFPVKIVCTPGATTIVNFGGGNPLQYTTPSMPMGTLCTITELTPQNTGTPMNCYWTPEYTKGQSVLIHNGPNSLVVQNSLTCLPEGETGSLTVKKTVKVDGNWSSWEASSTMMFQVNVSCQTPDGNTATQSVSLGAANQYQQMVSGIPLGSQCTITEPPLTNIFNPNTPCHWVITYPAGQTTTVTAGNHVLEVNNYQSCTTVPPGMAELKVQKHIQIDGRLAALSGWTFPLVVTCSSLNGGAPLTVSATVSGAPVGYQSNNVHYYQDTTFTVTPGDTCSVNEPSLPPLPSNLSDCNWVSGYPIYKWFTDTTSGQGASITAAFAEHPYRLEVHNRVICPQPPAPPPPPPCAAPMIPGPVAGTCVCPAGTTQRGGTCVPVLACLPPMIANRSGTECICPPPMVQRGGECVMPIGPDIRSPRDDPFGNPPGGPRDRLGNPRGGQRGGPGGNFDRRR